MAFEHYIYAGTKRLRCGYTTGSCAALAAKAAVAVLLDADLGETVSIQTPAGIPVEAQVVECIRLGHQVRCGVRKDAGDDADVTDGLLICAQARRSSSAGVTIAGGPGVGRVTRPGLEQPVGEYAINNTPREMIRREVEAVCRANGYQGGIRVEISVPGGEAVAEKTFNANLGIAGGVSILGTTGLVEPRSLTALLDSIELEIRQRAAMEERRLILTPGNYGRAFLAALPGLAGVKPVCCSNFLGDSLDFCARYGFREVLVVGHFGKLVKLAGGIMNTHSRTADCRMELFCAHAALQGASTGTVRQLWEAATTDACIEILENAGLLQPVLYSLSMAMELHLRRRAGGAYQVEALAFSNRHGCLCRTAGAETLLEALGWRMEQGTGERQQR